MNMSDVYAITDLEGYATEMREAAAKSLSQSYEENLDDFISIGQMINLVNSECVGFDNKDRPLLNEDANETIYERTVTWIHNVGLAKLAAKGLVECAWDEKSNEMVFWANPEITKTTKKKRKSIDQSIKRRNKKKDS
jgi:hypothetical protein